MAAKKKAKAKTKTKAKPKRKKAAPKKKVKKTKKKVTKKAKKAAARVKKPKPKKAKARKPAAKAKASAPAPAPAAPAPAASTPVEAPGEKIGVVTHYYTHLQVAIIRLDTGTLRTGDTVHIKGHTSDFRQTVESMEVDHVHVDEVSAGQSFGLRVKEHAREHDIVYKVS